MDYKEFQGKRILIFPGLPLLRSVVMKAKEMGMYTVVTDYFTDWEQSPAKKIADEAYNISYTDLDAMAQLCRDKEIDGVFSAFSENSILAAAKLCEKIGKPFYATVEQLEIMSNKAKFKQLCRDNGVPTVEEYHIDLEHFEESCRNIKYPVIVKPVDNAGSRGITVAYDAEMLRRSVEYALDYSQSGEIVIERYMTGQESNLTYTLQNGEIVLSLMSDSQLSSTQRGQLNLPYMWLYPSRNYERCLKEVNENVKKMFRSIGMKEGSCFLTAFTEEDGIYFFEAGYRVGGGMNYIMQKEVYGKDYLELMLAYAVTGDSSTAYTLDYDDFSSFKPCGNLVILLKGGTISKYIGFEKLNDLKGVLDFDPGALKPIGTTINAVGDYGQNLCRVVLMSESADDLANIIDAIYETIDVLDEHGESMLMGRLDTDIIRNYWEKKV